MPDRDARPCIGDCGQPAEDGDVYCDGCRSAVQRGSWHPGIDAGDMERD